MLHPSPACYLLPCDTPFVPPSLQHCRVFQPRRYPGVHQLPARVSMSQHHDGGLAVRGRHVLSERTDSMHWLPVPQPLRERGGLRPLLQLPGGLLVRLRGQRARQVPCWLLFERGGRRVQPLRCGHVPARLRPVVVPVVPRRLRVPAGGLHCDVLHAGLLLRGRSVRLHHLCAMDAQPRRLRRVRPVCCRHRLSVRPDPDSECLYSRLLVARRRAGVLRHLSGRLPVQQPRGAACGVCPGVLFVDRLDFLHCLSGGLLLREPRLSADPVPRGHV
jgi:hypothetical protein